MEAIVVLQKSMLKKGEETDETDDTCDAATGEGTTAPKYVLYLTQSYKSECCAWEIERLVRKMLLCLITTLLPVTYSPSWQMESVSLVLIASLLLHFIFKPYNVDLWNATESLASTEVHVGSGKHSWYVGGCALGTSGLIQCCSEYGCSWDACRMYGTQLGAVIDNHYRWDNTQLNMGSQWLLIISPFTKWDANPSTVCIPNSLFMGN